MIRPLLLSIALIALSVSVFGQYNPNQVRKVNSLPATCTAGTTTPVVYGAVVYTCTATNTWTATNPGQLPTSTYAGLPTCAAGNDGQLYRVTDANRDIYSCYGSAGKWVSRNGGVYNVGDFGASPSVSASVNVSSIQATIDAANANGGGWVEFPEVGTYQTNSTLIIKPNVNFRTSTVRDQSTVGTAIGYVGSGYAFAANSASNIGLRIEGLSVDLTSAPSALGAFNLSNCSHSQISNVHIRFYDSPSALQIGFYLEDLGYHSYYNSFYHDSGFVNTDGSNCTLYYFQNSANSQTIVGGSSVRLRYAVTADNVNDVNIFGHQVDGQAWKYGYWALNGTIGLHVYGGRLEQITATISSAVRSSNVITVTTTTAHSLRVGDTVRIYLSGDATFHAAYTIATVTDSTHFTVASNGADSSPSNSGYLAAGVGLYCDSTSNYNYISYPTLQNVALTLSDQTVGGLNNADSVDGILGNVAKRNAPTVTVTAISGGTTSLALSPGCVTSVTMPAGNTTLTAETVPVGPVWISVTQDNIGSRQITWNSLFLFAGGTKPTLTTVARATDQFHFICNGSTCTLVSAIYNVQ